MKNSLDTFLQTRLQQHHEQNLTRAFHARQNIFRAYAQYDKKNYLAFTNNDYLGLSHHPEVIKAAQQAAEQYGVGSTASHTLGGHTQAHEELEQALAKFTQRSAALVFSTGFMTNLGVISALMNNEDHIFADRLVHASIIDGIHLSKVPLVRYHHNNMQHLELKLARYPDGHKLIVSDGVFSMDGDLAPLPELVTLAQKNHAWLMIDDAHGLGVLGNNGGGCCEQFHLTENDVPILAGTLSKAFGCFGGFVAGSEILIESIRQFARSYMFTTALPPLLAHASLASLKVMQTETWRREHLLDLINYFRKRAAEINLPVMPSTTAIQPIVVGDNLKVMTIQQQLRERGILVAAIRPPTVPAHTARLRVSLNATHSHADIDKLIEAFSLIT